MPDGYVEYEWGVGFGTSEAASIIEKKQAEAERKRHAAHKALEAEAGMRGLFFLSEEDLKAVNSIRADASGKNLLAVLRHVGRPKEFKHGGMRCWQAR